MILSLVGCASGGNGPPAKPGPAKPTAETHRFEALNAKIPGLLANNRERLDEMMRAVGVGSSTYDPAHKPVAVFDWDNTVMRNDIGDATFFWMLRHDKILQPPGRDWDVTNRKLTPAAREVLNGACDSLAEPEHPLPTSSSAACADALLAIYDGKTPSGAAAWDQESTLTMHQPYGWVAQLQAGYTPAEVSAFAKQAFAENAAAPVGTKQKVGSHEVTGWVRIYEPMRDLIHALGHNGFEVWVVSASAQPLVAVTGERVGVPPDHVVGIRTMVDSAGKLTYRLAGCGTEPDGADTVITFNQGKRCWINKAIFRLPPQAQLGKADAAHRPAFAAGDSDTDLAMVQDATQLRLVINRNKMGVMCNAYASHEGRWLVQPMFIEPLPQRAEPYSCSTARDATGAPLVDEVGKPMADVQDRVFALP